MTRHAHRDLATLAINTAGTLLTLGLCLGILLEAL